MRHYRIVREFGYGAEKYYPQVKQWTCRGLFSEWASVIGPYEWFSTKEEAEQFICHLQGRLPKQEVVGEYHE